MLRDQIINFLEAAVIFLLMTNAVSVAAAVYAMRLANRLGFRPDAGSALERRIDAFLRRAA